MKRIGFLLALMAFTVVSTILWEVIGNTPVPALPVSPVRRVNETSPAENATEEVMASTTERIPDRTSGCQPIGNIVFLKTHKTGSTTMRSVLNRYGIDNNLSFLHHKSKPGGHLVSDLDKLPLSAFLPPLGVRKGDLKHYKGYNISNTHVRLSVSKFEELMSPNPTYITILRHPVEQWLSAFQYFHVYRSFRKYNSSEKDRVEVFLSDPKKFAGKSVYSWNNQFHDLGVSRSHFRDWGYLDKRIKYFSKLFRLVLITEYFDESLILLKDLLCWSFDDILYVKMRAQPKPLEVNVETRSRIWKWNRADAMLYTYFNDTLWRSIRDYGPNFQRDLDHFRVLLDQKYEECIGESEVVKVAGNHKNVIYGVKNRSKFCEALVSRGLVGEIHNRQYNQLIPLSTEDAATSSSQTTNKTKRMPSETSFKKSKVAFIPSVTPKHVVIPSPDIATPTNKTGNGTSSNESNAPVWPKVKIKGRCNTSQGNVVFVKTHKTGSTTLTAILNRYGLTRNLSFIHMADADAGHFNYHSPSLSRRKEFLPPIGVPKGNFKKYVGYNISAVHIIYSRGLMETLMGESVTYYITIIREPVSQFVSAFQYFDVAKNVLHEKADNLSLEESVNKVLSQSQTVFNKRPYTWNNQLLDLGMKKSHMRDEFAVKSHLVTLLRELDLVLITEYFDESLILLKKLLCWEFEDILYIKMRMQPSNGGKLSAPTLDRIRTHNSADGMVYDFFNKTLWRKIKAYGPSFDDDLRTFRDLLNKTVDSCVGDTVVQTLNRGQKNVGYLAAEDAPLMCEDIVDTGKVVREIRRRQGG